MVASDVAKWRGSLSAWWRLGCGGLDLTLIFVLDFVPSYYCENCLLVSEIFIEFVEGSFCLLLILNFSFLYAGTYRRNSHPSSGRIF